MGISNRSSHPALSEYCAVAEEIVQANVLVKKDGHAALCDFGLTKMLGQGLHGFTTTAGFKGSMQWCSPEVLNSEANMKTPSSDMWAFALLVWEVSPVQWSISLVRL